MAKISKAQIDKKLRNFVFDTLFNETVVGETGVEFTQINDRQYGILVKDDNGDERYLRVGVIVAELREDMTAQELMDSEIAEYQMKQAEKAKKAKAKAEKIAKDKAKREAEKKEGY